MLTFVNLFDIMMLRQSIIWFCLQASLNFVWRFGLALCVSTCSADKKKYNRFVYSCQQNFLKKFKFVYNIQERNSKTMNYDEYAERCRNIGKSCSGLAGEAGVSRTTISRWKAGTSEPSPQSMFRLVQILKDYEPQEQVLTRTASVTGVPVQPPKPEKTVIYAPDNAMIYDSIPKGAEITLIAAEPEDADIVAVIMDNKTIIRKYTLKDNLIILSASNPKYFLITLTVDEFNAAYLGVCDKVTFHISHS